MFDVRIKPVETLLFRSDVVAAGKFRCPSTHPLFRDSGPCSHHTFVFPRTVTRIRVDDGRTLTGSPSAVLFYNQDQLYTRAKVSDVDASDWYTVADDVLGEMLRTDDLRRPFRMTDAPIDAKTFLAQRAIFDRLDARTPIDALEVEESILNVLRRVVARVPIAQKKRDAVEDVKAIVARYAARNPSLRELAAAVSMSPFELCRTFRAQTGETITKYRHTLRLRLALDQLRDRRLDLTALALDLGYSSHSHFTFAFRRAFGITPSAWRARS